MLPTPSDVHVDAVLTNVSVAYLQSADAFVAAKVFPNVPVQKQSDRYYTYDRGDFNRDEMEIRAPATESAGGGYRLDNTPTYYCPVYAYHKDIPDEVRDNADAVLNQNSEATQFCSLKALIKREKIFVTKFFTSGLWTTGYTATTASPGTNQVIRWNMSTSTPIEDIRLTKRTVMESTGFAPNKLVLGRAVYDALLDHPDIIDRLKAGQTPGGPAMANRVALAQIFEVGEILVMDSIQNTAKEGQTNSHSFIGGKHALLVYAAPNPGLMTPTGGYTFTWVGHIGAGALGNRITNFRMPQLKSDRIEIEMAFDMKLVSADLGVFFTSVVA